jgi:branched-chain amino acid transport system substrate-binding protein
MIYANGSSSVRHQEIHVSAFNRAILTGGAAACLVGAMLGFASAEPCPTQCASGNVPLGLAVPLSGAAAAFGQPTAKAVEIAVRELNATGGVMGIPVNLAVRDDRCDAGMAASVATQHVEQDKVKFVIGPTCPAVAMDAAPIYAKAGVIQFVPTVTMVGLTRRFPDNIFRMVATDEQEAQALGAYLAREQKGKKFAVVYGDFFYRRAIARMVELALSPEQKALARFEPLPDVSGAYDRLADKLQRTPADVIYLSLDAEQVVEFVRKLRDRGVKSLLLGGQQLLSQGFWRTSRATAEGIHVIAPIESLDSAELRKAVDLLKQSDVIPDIVTVSHFAAVQTWAEAVRRAGGGEPKKVIEALRSGEFKTAVGRVAFDQRGDRRDIRYSILTWKNGRLVPGVEWHQ